MNHCQVGVCSSPVHCKEIGRCVSAGSLCTRNPAPNAEAPLAPMSPTVTVQIGQPQPSAEWLVLQEIAKLCGFERTWPAPDDSKFWMLERAGEPGHIKVTPLLIYLQVKLGCMAAIDRLRAAEGDSVEIVYDNPDYNGQPNCLVICHDLDGNEARYGADTLLQALQTAVIARNNIEPKT